MVFLIMTPFVRESKSDLVPSYQNSGGIHTTTCQATASKYSDGISSKYSNGISSTHAVAFAKLSRMRA